MAFRVVEHDITKMECDAIVNAANRTLLGGGGVDWAIHRAAGIRLYAKCITMGGCATGNAKITPGYNMSCRYIIHTVGPRWHGGRHGEDRLLSSCYRKSLELAEEYGCRSIAFPLISAGIFEYPKEMARQVAEETIEDFLKNHDMDVYLCLYEKKKST